MAASRYARTSRMVTGPAESDTRPALESGGRS
jgi:hypothetical protein